MSDEAMTLEVDTHLGHVKISATDNSMPNLFLHPEAALDLARKIKRAALRARRGVQ
jgi:hypothetical protein